MANIQGMTMRNTERWAKAKLTRGPEFVSVAKRLLSAKIRYQGIEEKTGVPWFVVAVIHEREAAQDFTKSIAQGDPWNRASIHVPKGRGPFKSWEAAAIDALTLCAPYAAQWKDWSPGGTLTLLEQYNGLGYANKGLPSPYIWSGTDQYVKGKYVADGVFDANVVDKQLGCAGLLLAMQSIDTSIQFASYKPNLAPSIIPPPPDVEPVPVPPVNKPHPAKYSAMIIAVAATLEAVVQTNSIAILTGIVALGIAAVLAVHFLWPNTRK
jgi:lysozyme family protein